MIERLFQCRARGSRWDLEILAGISTFLSLSYIFIVNPAMLGQAGMPRHAVLFATIATSAIATLVMGLWANLPYVLAPGMEINTYVAFYAIAVAGLSWREALGAVFWSGVLFLLLTLSGVRERVIHALPEGMKDAVAASVGALLAVVALRFAGVLQYDEVILRGIAVPDRRFLLLIVTAVVLFGLTALKVRAAVLLSIVAGVLVAVPLHVAVPGAHAQDGLGWFAGIGAADLRILLRPEAWTVVLVLFLVDFYGSVAKLVGLSRNTMLLQDGNLPRFREALLVDGAAASTGALLGTTSVLVYAESGVGIAAGGRTGLTAVTAGIAMLTCFAAAPLLVYVPEAATSGALLYVAVRLFPKIASLKQFDVWQWIALAGMATVVVVTSALHGALLFGLAIHVVRDFSKGVRLNPYSIGSLGLLVVGWVWSR